MYPLLEIISGALFALLFFKFPFLDAETLTFNGEFLGRYLLAAFYLFVLIFTFFYDLKYMKIADEILLPAVAIGLLATINSFSMHPFSALLGGAIGAGFFALQYGLSQGKWVGLGDVRIGAFMGVMLGWKLVLVALFVSYLVGTIASLGIALQRQKFFGVRIPLGPFLVIGTLVAFFSGEALLAWYFNGFL